MIVTIPQDYDFRTIVPSDYESLALLFTINNIPDVTNNFKAFPLNEESAKYISSYTGKDMYFISIVEKEIVGFTMLRGWDEGYEIPSFGIFISCHHQGKGYGKLLLQSTLDQAKLRGCNGVRLSVFGSNNKAFDLYLKTGFVKVSTEPIITNGKQDLKIIMYRELS